MDKKLVLDQLINCMPQHIFWKDRQGTFLGCNELFARQFGYADENGIIGKNDYDFDWSPELRDKYIADDQAIMGTGKPKLNFEEPQKQPDGSIKTVLVNKLPLYGHDNEIIGLLGTYLDITELKQAQANEKLALQKAAADEATKRALLIFSGMSTHDLRTPLSSINLRAAFLRKYVPALLEGYKLASEADFNVPFIQPKILADLPQAPDDIMQGVREANDYIDASLKSLKGASQGEDLINKDELVDCNADRLLRRVIDGYPYEAKQRDLLHWDNDHDFNFRGNIIFFNRLIENLIKNAFEQIELKGKGEIFVECTHADQFNIIKIKDTAGGVTQAIIDQLFSGIKSTKKGGTGIGLSSAKQIMHGMNGNIECHLIEGDCIEFVLSFPILQGA